MTLPNNYRPIAGPMCRNCKHAEIGYEGEVLCKLEEGKDLLDRLVFDGYSWCRSHTPTQDYLDYFEKHHNGVLPMVVMVPKPDDDGECNPSCEAFDSLDRWCNLDRANDGKPGPGCPQYRGEN